MTKRAVACPHGCGEDAPTTDYLAAHIEHVHGFDKARAREQAEIAARAPVPHEEEAPVAKKCGKCGEAGHNARRCGKPASKPRATARARNGGDPVLHAIDTKIGALRRQIEALEAAREALA